VTSAEPVLCRLELDAFGTPPRRLWLEARERPQGFSVWFWDEHLYPDGTELAASDSAYNARTFAGIILDARLAAALHDDPEVVVPSNAWRAVKVTGERGLKAAVLSLALTTGRWDTPWFMQQSDISFEALHTLIDELDDDWWMLCRCVCGLANALKLDSDAMSVLRRYDLPPSATGLRELYKVLDRESERQRNARQAEGEALIAPFRLDIEAIAAKFEDRPVHGGGSGWGTHRSSMRRFLEDYVVEHGRMPQGKVLVERKEPSFRHIPMGLIDFDQLHALERWPPGRDEDAR
jgi:hypothetical protein